MLMKYIPLVKDYVLHIPLWEKKGHNGNFDKGVIITTSPLHEGMLYDIPFAQGVYILFLITSSRSSRATGTRNETAIS